MRRVRHCARALDPLVARLLPVCQDLTSARNELRWIKERAEPNRLRHLVNRRACGEPLQYVLGTTYFGPLELQCRPGVLIPRQDTATWVSYLAHSVPSPPGDRLHLLDLCTGSGCIPLLFHHEFYSIPRNSQSALCLTALDVSHDALELTRKNCQIQFSSLASAPNRQFLQHMHIAQANVLDQSSVLKALEKIDRHAKVDILTCNPPYIAPKDFESLDRSVKNFEPKSALVPCHEPLHTARPLLDSKVDVDGDTFYPILFKLASRLRVKTVCLEVGDTEQAMRVASFAAKDWDSVKVIRDDPDHAQTTLLQLEGGKVLFVGRGHGRAVVASTQKQ
ncbi:modification methylase HemK [Piedraia hortae CBS 480.64]|uniref:Modification methylase HemK n=1 Tax=Piedraia hortae CBS 480.64 TaxID=1314780 RepID=A0A6A7BTR6_9PEZI|nr:modification methylase HemK [Piedraia hortae CBS 480.64]